MQILKTGFFHADPHPSRIDTDEAIIYYDFGMMGEIKSFTRERLLELFYLVSEKDAKKFCPRYGHVNLLFANASYEKSNRSRGTPANGRSFFGEEVGAVLSRQLTESKSRSRADTFSNRRGRIDNEPVLTPMQVK